MKGALTIAAAELRQHLIVVWAGLLLGLLPLLVHFLVYGTPLRPDGPGQYSNADSIVWATAINLSLAIAFGVGAGIVSRDLSERRLGFYLARPLPLFQYWAGKTGTAFLLAVLAGALALLPAHLLGAMSWTETGNALARNGRAWLGALAFAVAASSAAGGAFRARSGLLIVDIVMLPLTGAGIWFALGNAWGAGTGEVLVRFAMPWLSWAAILVLFAAGAVQICVGRLDLRRGHALLSAIAWGGLWLFFVLGIVATSRYVLGTTPAEIRLPYVSVSAPSSGSHVMIDSISTAWGHVYHPGFLLDAQGGFVRMGGLEGLSGLDLNGVAWSRDGRTFAWSKEAPFRSPDIPSGGQPPFASGPGFEPSIQVQRLDRPGLPARRFLREQVGDAVRAVSPSGQRLLVESRGHKEVVDSETGRTITSLEEAPPWRAATFLSESSIRALRLGTEPPAVSAGGSRLLQGQVTVLDWDLATGHLAERGTIAIQGERAGFARVVPTEDWERVIRLDTSGLFLHDKDGRILATLVDGWTTRVNRTAGPLSGGRCALIEGEPEGLRLRVFGRDGRTLAEGRFKGRSPLRVGGESTSGVLALGVAPLSREGERTTLFVDLASGNVTRREPGLDPALRLWELGRTPDAWTPEPGSLATRLFLGDGVLMSLDPATGARKVLVTQRDRLPE